MKTISMDERAFEIPSDWGCDDDGGCQRECEHYEPNDHDFDCKVCHEHIGIGEFCYRIREAVCCTTTFTRAKPKPRYKVELADPQPEMVFGKVVWSIGPNYVIWVRTEAEWQVAGRSDTALAPRRLGHQDQSDWHLTKGKDMPSGAYDLALKSGRYIVDLWYFWREVTS